MKLYNSLSKKVEEFVPINPPNVGLYTCGMTVYDYAHIGHGRKYVGDDILRRVLTRFGYKVKHVQNVTDVGHLVSDADEGEDKLEKGAAKTGKTVWEVAEFFTKHFYDSMDKLDVLRPDIICKATDNIKEQVALVSKLVKKGFAYDTPEAVYFDISKFPNYGKLFGQKLEEKKTAAREEVKTGEFKKNPADFALWFKRTGRFADHTMHWESPWGDGFPGWHIECSAMSMKYLGDTFDIHTGGIDHIPVHHPNEIAQSEGATGKPFVKYWVHHAFLTVDGKKMSKSLGNFHTIEDVEKKGFDPLALRYFYFTAHYRSSQNFTWEALGAAQKALGELRGHVDGRAALSQEKLEKVDAYQKKFDEALANDLNMPQALAVVWEVAKSNIPSQDKHDLLLDFDEVLGLDLSRKTQVKKIPDEIMKLVQKREDLRKENKFNEADDMRKIIEGKGYRVEDTEEGPLTSKL
ncbi:cysteine--tRNA ligase [Candidatus Gottesmanbacteria bacterium RIFCSPLOWO2_01_FULL_43_11b]|uniref:Cysteine--tRNA ligase n=1 Tax=Candidatus Gottesmanbacteria bacterium RIFCSPLOWO2_01_FULL_43_11b TaxID=1798392 RepID=A0A1F6AK63_9BACT|nr:MAG: cysteine--tRNA ligase [Candidatus Gottesmanbacteria bacterium RIFCSPLOWO2_01_FULL_43_11b]